VQIGPRSTTFYLLLAALAACSDEGPRLTIELTPGGETDAFTRAPAPTKLEIDGVAPDGTVKALGRGAFRTSNDVGNVDRGGVLTFRVRASADTGSVLLSGETLPIAVDVPDDTARVRVFVQRPGEFARLPGTITLTDAGSLLDRVGDQYVVVANGNHAELFDLVSWTSRAFALPIAPRSIAATAQGLVVIDDSGAAIVDLSGTSTPLSAPAGLAFADVAGGALVRGENGVSYLVGGTRDRATSAVLRIGDDASLSVLRLTTERAGAAAAYVKGRGVVVIGGSTTASGVEVVGDAASSAVPFPPDPTQFAAAASVDDSHVIVISDTAQARSVDLACSAACVQAVWGSADPLALSRPAAFALSDGSVIAVSSDKPDKALRFTATARTEVALRVRHAAAHLARGIAGAALLVGGAPEVESLSP
jgi:hypothetical protein